MEHKKNNHEHHTAHKSKTESEADDKTSKNRSLFYVIIGVIMVIIILGAILVLSRYVFPNKNIVEYNHYVFEKFEGNKWMTQQLIGGQVYNIPFYNNPLQVLDIPVDPMSITAIRYFRNNPNGTVYITVDPYESSKVVLANVEYARILGTAYNIYNMNVKSAISQNIDNITEYQVMTCNNQSKNNFIIYQRVTDKNLISLNGNCIVLESKTANESIRVADAFAFRLLNIIKDEPDNSTLTGPNK